MHNSRSAAGEVVAVGGDLCTVGAVAAFDVRDGGGRAVQVACCGLDGDASGVATRAELAGAMGSGGSLSRW